MCPQMSFLNETYIKHIFLGVLEGEMKTSPLCYDIPWFLVGGISWKKTMEQQAMFVMPPGNTSVFSWKM